ncbi:hypothetical protein PCANB_001147 [Pneumocystis canis]|nr:hypothetical protein PCANB_001147 [Pneumocystis canis]
MKEQNGVVMEENDTTILNFCNHFWGKNEQGVNVLFNRMNEAKTICEEIRSFYKDWATIEEEYSRRLYRLIRGTLGSYEIGTLRESFNTLQKETETIAKQHSNIALQIRSELEEPLHTLSSDMRIARKEIQSNLEKLRRIKTAQEQQVQKCKEKIEDKNGKISGYGSQSGLFLGKNSDKNSSKADKAQIMAQNNNDYMLAITVLQETSIKWIREWKIACDKFQDLEEKRINFIKDGLWAFSTIISAAYVSNSKSCEKIRASIEKCNPQNDIQLFIRTKGTGQEIPNPPKSGDPRNGFEDLNQSDYSIAQFFRVSDPQFRSDAMMHHSILNENSIFLPPKASSLSESQTEQSSKVDANGIPLDGITQFCKNDFLISNSSNAKSSSLVSTHSHNNETRSNTSFFGFKEQIKKDATSILGFIGKNRHSFGSSDKQSEFVSSLDDSSSISTNRTAKTRCRSSSPFKNFDSKKNHETTKSPLLERLKGMGVVSDSEIEPIDPRANVMLNVGNNMFEVESNMKKQKPELYGPEDPVASALSQFKISSKIPLPAKKEPTRVSWLNPVDKNHIQSAELMEGKYCFPTEQPQKLSPNIHSAPISVPQKPNLFVSNKLAKQHDTLNTPPTAITSAKMNHINQSYIAQMKDIYGPSEKNTYSQYDMMMNNQDPYYDQVQRNIYADKELMPVVREKIQDGKHQMLENMRMPIASGKVHYADPRHISRAASPQPPYQVLSSDHEYPRSGSRSPIVYKSVSPGFRYVPGIERPIESFSNNRMQRSLTPGPSMKNSDQFYCRVSREQPPVSSVFDIVLDANGNLINKYSRARSASPCSSSHKPIPRNGYNYNVPMEHPPYNNSVHNDYDDYYRENLRTFNQAPIHSDSKTYINNNSAFPQYTEDGKRILFYVQALYDYQAAIPEEISFVKNDILLVLEMQEDGWWEGQVVSPKKSKRGLFPSNFVQRTSIISNNSVWGFLDLSSEERFVDKQSYNIFLELLVPLSESNIHIGNFMTNIKLFSESGILMNSSRPAILTFSSLLLTKLKTLIMLPIFLLGFIREEERLIIPLIEGFKYHKAHKIMLKSVNITFSHNIQVYSSKLIFSAQLQGIK